jgi:hypothetical protein
MFFSHWTWRLQKALAPPPGPSRRRKARRPARAAPSYGRLYPEGLEDRTVPSLFGPPTPFAVHGGAGLMAVGDFNGDGIPDLAVPNGGTGTGTVSVLLANRDGTFQNAKTYPVGLGPVSAAVGDFNRDGILDLAVVNYPDATVSVLLGDGHGNFSPAANSPVPVGPDPNSVAVGDFNDDGIPDLAVPNKNGVGVLLGNGDGTFQDAKNYPAGLGPYSVAVGDFDRDGTSDVAVVNYLSNTVSVLLANGDGSFQSPKSITVGAGPLSVAVGDFDANGILDLAVVNNTDATVSALLGDGHGGFKTAFSGPVGSGAFQVAVGDFNRDGYSDVAVTNVNDNTVSVLLTNSVGTGFTPDATYPIVTGAGSVAVGDFNHDGALDLAVGGAPVDVLLNQSPVTTTVLVNANYTNPAVAGQLVSLAAYVAEAVPQPNRPTGLLTFKDTFEGTTTVLGTGTLDAAGHATLRTYSLGAGYHHITAVYEGDPNFTTSTSPVLNQLVNQDATTTTLTASANPAVAGQPVTLTATVSPVVPGFGPPTGNVLFLDDGATIGSGKLSGGIATFTTTALVDPVTHYLSAVYVGDSNFLGGTPAYLAEFINIPAPVLTSLGTTSVPEGSGTFTLTLNGSGFLSGSTVQWNDKTLSPTVATSPTQIQVTIPKEYLAEEGTAKLTVFTPGVGTSLPLTFTITDAPLAASGSNIAVTGAKKFNGVVATFTDGNPKAAIGDFTAIITWDDGTASFGTIAVAGAGFQVSGSHTFTKFNTVHVVTVTIYDKGGSTATVTDNVIDPAGPAAAGVPGGSDSGAAALPGETPPAVHGKHHHHHRRHHHHPAHAHRGHPPAPFAE